jgi:hypothetical protein
MAMQLAPIISMLIAFPKLMSTDISCGLYRTINNDTVPIPAPYFVLVPIYEFFNLIFFIVTIGLCSPIDKRMNMYVGWWQLIIINVVVTIMYFVQTSGNGICLRSNIIVHCSLGMASWIIVSMLSLTLSLHMKRTGIHDQWQCFKYILYQEVFNTENYFWFKYRIGYLIILLTHIILAASQYTFTITMCVIRGSPDLISIIIFSMFTTFDIIYQLIFIGYTPFYYMDRYDLDNSDSDWKIWSKRFMIVKVISIVVANIVQILLVRYIDYQTIQLFIPIIVYVTIWIAVPAVYCGVVLIRIFFDMCTGLFKTRDIQYN